MKINGITLSKLLSYLLHPLLIPILAISILMLRQDLYSIELPLSLSIWFLSVVFVFTLLIPLAGIFILLKLNALYSIEMNQRNERTVPLFMSSVSYMALLYFLKSATVPAVYLYVLYSASFALLAGLLINMVYKISLHTLGWSALTTTLVGISMRMGASLVFMISMAAMLAGLAGYARLKENAHNQTQVYLGYLAGVSVIVLIMFLF